MQIKVRVTDGFWHRGKVVNPGDVIELDVEVALTVIGMGKAEPCHPTELLAAQATVQKATIARLATHEQQSNRWFRR